VRGKNFLANCGELRNLGEGFSNVITKEAKKAAFTLAEVLIVIAVVGVVAAITLPTLQKQITKAVLKKQIKKTMSIVNQNYRLAKDEVGAVCDGTNCYDFNKAFINKFKLARICNGNGLKDKCIPEYEGLNVSGCSGFGESDMYNYNTIHTTLDGIILIPYAFSWRSLWLVDVNGMKGPNKAGWDLFQIDFDDLSVDRAIFRAASCINQKAEVKGGVTTTGLEVTFKMIDEW
jgi:prepilin-type N-terminal cleavage/methylation domain-containing protein